MQVSRRSLNYKLWKFWHDDYKEPKNLCRYFWYSVFQWTIGMLIFGVIGTVWGVIVGVAAFFGWIFGRRLESLSYTFQGCGFDYYPYKNNLYNVKATAYGNMRKNKIAPWEALLALGYIASWFFSVKLAIIVTVSLVGLAIGILIGMLLFKSSKKMRATEVYRLTKEYLKAKKAKVCPTIEVVD